ncbi:unnamed protein product [Effrenium voratum]|nr:unnamed protein product [Effrenium voratum]
MAPLETPVADGALRSMCRVVAKLLSPDVQDRKNPDPDLRHLQVCQKILQSQKEASNPPPQAQPPPSPRYAGRINSELHQSSLRTQPVVAVEQSQETKRQHPEGLSAWAKEEAVRYFRENLALDDKWATGWSHVRSELCLAHFRKLIDGWYPGRKDFWKHCQDFCKEWAGWQSGPPKSRPLSAGRLNNYLTHLHRGSTHKVEEIVPTPEILAAVDRFGIRVTDIRLTSTSIFDACRTWTGLDWDQGHAADPCPWPVPQAFDGLKCSWRLLARSFGHSRIYLNPPWSQLDSWLHKAALEYASGLQILAVVPRWTEESCISALTVAQTENRLAMPLRLKTRRLWDAEFAHPSSGHKMAPLDVTLIWML